MLTSATLAPGFGPHLGLPQRADELLDVGSPFDYPANGLIYCASRLPRPTDPRWADLAIDELAALVEAAGGRTLALFTSYKAMDRAVDALRERLPFPLLAQGEQPKQALIERFSRDPETCLFATMSFWQGIDVPGRVAVAGHDRPAAVPPARRPAAPGPARARRRRGVPRHRRARGRPRCWRRASGGSSARPPTAGAVAVLDPRLATARYGPKIVATLPRMRRTRDRAEVEAFLRELRRAGSAAA